VLHARGAPPLTHFRGVLAKPETRSAEAGAAIASRRDGAFAPESWDPSASRPYLGGQTLRKNSLCHLRNADEFIAFFPNGNILNASARLAPYFPEREYF